MNPPHYLRKWSSSEILRLIFILLVSKGISFCWACLNSLLSRKFYITIKCPSAIPLKNKHSEFCFNFSNIFFGSLLSCLKKFLKSTLSFIWERKSNVRKPVHSPRKKHGKLNRASVLSAHCGIVADTCTGKPKGIPPETLWNRFPRSESSAHCGSDRTVVGMQVKQASSLW